MNEQVQAWMDLWRCHVAGDDDGFAEAVAGVDGASPFHHYDHQIRSLCSRLAWHGRVLLCHETDDPNQGVQLWFHRVPDHHGLTKGTAMITVHPVWGNFAIGQQGPGGMWTTMAVTPYDKTKPVPAFQRIFDGRAYAQVQIYAPVNGTEYVVRMRAPGEVPFAYNWQPQVGKMMLLDTVGDDEPVVEYDWRWGGNA